LELEKLEVIEINTEKKKFPGKNGTLKEKKWLRRLCLRPEYVNELDVGGDR